MFYIHLFWKWTTLAFALGPVQDASGYSMFLSIVLDVLAFAFLVVGGIALYSAKRKRKTQAQARAVATQAAGQPPRNVIITRLVLTVVPMMGLLLISFGASFVPSNLFTNNFSPTVIVSPARSPTVARVTPTPTPPVSPPNDLLTPGVLTVGSDTNLPPQSYVDANGHTTGFDIGLITAIAQQMGLKVNVVPTDFSQLIPDLNSEMFDVVISAYPLTSDIQNQVQSVPYLSPADVLLVSKANPAITTFKHLTDLCGHTIGVLAGSNEDNTLKAEKQNCSQGKSITLHELQSVDDVANALAMGNVDATYQDSPTSVYYLNITSKYSGKFKPVGSRIPIAQEGILIRTGDMAMDASIQSAFAMVKGDMKYTQLLQQWGLKPDQLVAS